MGIERCDGDSLVTVRRVASNVNLLFPFSSLLNSGYDALVCQYLLTLIDKKCMNIAKKMYV